VKRTAFFVIATLTPLTLSPEEEHSAPQGNRGAQIKVDARVRAPKIIGVRIHHEMCPYCKELSSSFALLCCLLHRME